MQNLPGSPQNQVTVRQRSAAELLHCEDKPATQKESKGLGAKLKRGGHIYRNNRPGGALICLELTMCSCVERGRREIRGGEREREKRRGLCGERKGGVHVGRI